MEILYKIIELAIPFEWVKYDFMKNALIAVLLATPLFALMGSAVINNRMAFFSDVLGHSALTGIAIGALLGMREFLWPMVIFAVLLAVLMNLFKNVTHASSDTTLGVFFAIIIALGVAILSRGGGFPKFTAYLIGDILAVTPSEITLLAAMLVFLVVYWIFASNSLFLISVNPSLARSRGISVFWMETLFSVVLALTVMLSIRLVGILIINSLLILPAAASRIASRNIRTYTISALLISIVSGVAGLISSYYLGTASGATIALFAALFYCVIALFAAVLRVKKS